MRFSAFAVERLEVRGVSVLELMVYGSERLKPNVHLSCVLHECVFELLWIFGCWSRDWRPYMYPTRAGIYCSGLMGPRVLVFRV